MNDHVTGHMICDPEELKRASVDYLSSLLRNRDPKEGYKEDLKTLRILHEQRMLEECSDEESLSENDFQNMMKKLKKKKADKYKFILNGGKSYQNVLFCLYKKVWGSENKPNSWEITNCTMLFKMKGCRNEFGNQRFIHSKDEIPKCFESLVIEKEKLFKDVPSSKLAASQDIKQLNIFLH